MKLFVFGLGYSSLATAARMQPMLEHLAGTTRTPDRAKALKTAGIDRPASEHRSKPVG